MKRIEQKLKRKVKYWRITYQQATGRDRLALGLFALMLLAYVWWISLTL